MKKKIFVICLLIAAFFVNPAKGQFQVPFLNQVASNFAKRSVVVKCKNTQEDSILSYAWAYVEKPASEAKYTIMDDSLCVGALAIDLDVPEVNEYLKVLGAAVLIHESFHLKRIDNNEDEAMTECRAMQNYDHVLIKLGAEEETINRLLPLMVLNHFLFIKRNINYYLPNCVTPARYAKWGIT